MKEEIEKGTTLPLMSLSDFIKFIYLKNFSNEEKMTILNRYVYFLESFDYSYIWEKDESDNFLFKTHEGYGYYEFDNSRFGKFIKVTDSVYQKAKGNILLTGNINIQNRGKVFIDSDSLHFRLTINNIFGMTIHSTQELIEYNLTLTNEGLKHIGLIP